MNRRTWFGLLDPAMGAAASSVFLPADSLAPDSPCPAGLNTIVTDQMLPTIRYLASYGVDEVEGIENDLGLARPGMGRRCPPAATPPRSRGLGHGNGNR